MQKYLYLTFQRHISSQFALLNERTLDETAQACHKDLRTGLNFNGPVICLNLNKYADLHSTVVEFLKYINFIMTFEDFR